MVNGQWIDIAGIVFACTAANHLGLIQAVETVIHRRLPIVSCVKCLTFWAVLVYELWRVGFSDIPTVLAISFLSAWSAIWLDLFMGIIDKKGPKKIGNVRYKVINPISWFYKFKQTLP